MDNSPHQSDLDVEECYHTAISRFSKQGIENYHQLSRGNAGCLDSKNLRLELEGLEYRRFIKEHFRTTGCDKLLLEIAGTFAAFNSVEREAAKAILKMYDHYAIDANFWRSDCREVSHDIGRSFEQVLAATGYQAEDKMKFNMFKLVSCNFAVIALHGNELRKLSSGHWGWRQAAD